MLNGTEIDLDVLELIQSSDRAVNEAVDAALRLVMSSPWLLSLLSLSQLPVPSSLRTPRFFSTEAQQAAAAYAAAFATAFAVGEVSPSVLDIVLEKRVALTPGEQRKTHTGLPDDELNARLCALILVMVEEHRQGNAADVFERLVWYLPTRAHALRASPPVSLATSGT